MSAPAGRTILLVEDQLGTVHIVTEQLKRFGYTVECAATGEEAVEIAADPARKIDLILMDILLGQGIDGAEAAKRILATQSIPIVFLSSHNEEEVVERVQGIPRYGFVQKNASQYILRSSLEMAFELFEAHRQKAESEELFRIAFEDAPTGMSILSADGMTYLAVNPLLCEMFGYTKEEFLGQTIRLVTHPDDVERSNEWIRKKRNGEPCETDFEKRYIHRDGRTIWGLVRSKWIKNKDGSPRMAISHIHDITSRKEAEEVLSRYRLLSESTNDIILFSRLRDLQIVEVNDAALRAYGYDREQLLTKTIRDLRSPETLETLPGLLEEIDSHGATFETVHLRRDGSTFPVEVSSRAMTIGSERILLSIIHDITERRKAEHALWVSANRLQRAESMAKTGNWEFTMDDSMMHLSESAKRICGLDADAVSADVLRSMVVPETRDMVSAALRNLIAHQVPFDIEHRICNQRTGAIVTIRSKAAYNAETKTVFGIMQDISDRKLLEQQLIQSQKMEGLGTLAGGIAHDFNNLLGMILGSAELLRKRSKGNPEFLKYIDGIIEASEKGASISRQLLVFSRPDVAELKPISLSHILVEIRDMLKHFLPKSITVETEVEVDNGIIMGDAGQIHQAILNLALNAGDAMLNAGTLTIREYTVPKEFIHSRFSEQIPGPAVAVSVSDTGIGMDPATLEKIFLPFFTTKAVGKGTGLGLAMVHGIVKNHRGFVDVASTPGIGTTFTLYFPAIVHTNMETIVDTIKSEEKRTGRILVVDDEPVLRELLFEYLNGSGYSVLVANNGEEALDVFREHHDAIDLVITDLGMAPMSGEELFINLKRIDPNVKVMVSSGYIDKLTNDNLHRMGFCGVINKPYRFNTIRDSIVRLIGKDV